MRKAAGWVVLTGLVLGCSDSPAPQPEAEAEPATYVADAVCADCHPAETRAWTGSDHDLAMQEATPTTVLGDFADARFDHYGVGYTFRRRGDRFFVETLGADGKPGEFEVRYTFGVEPLQQYLLEFEGGRLQALPIAWDVAARRWYPLYDEPTPPGDLLHWTGPLLNWNSMCADCHSTNVRRGFDVAHGTYATHWSEIDVGCQACHGPGSAHVAWAQAPSGDPGLAVRYAPDAPRAEVESCAPCHSRRHPVSVGYRPGEPWLDHYLPALLEEGLYYPDGQIQDEVYVYGSFVQSPMYAHGVRCSDCHDPHSTRLRAEGDALCTRCHRPDPPARFPSLASRVYASPEHHHHAPGTPGSACVDCHMPARTYMGIDPRRDHSLRVPRPDLAAALGTPDACSGCHTGRDAAWAADVVRGWYPNGRSGTPHFASVVAMGRAGRPGADADLARLAADTGQPAIVRATALSLLRRYPGAPALDVLSAALADPEPLLRVSAANSLAGFMSPALPRGLQRQLSRPLVPLLGDPRRAVRLEAVRALSALQPDVLDAGEQAALGTALREFEAVHRAQADDPGAWLALGVVQANRGRRDEAEASYRTALRLQPAFVPARFNLATLYNEEGRNAEAERELRAVLEVAPDHGDGHYSLGLLLAEMGRLDEAERQLAQAADALPERPRIHYNHGLALQQLGRLDEARRELEQAASLAPGDPDIAQALAALGAKPPRSPASSAAP